MKAAIVLGYTEQMWDNDKPAPCDDKDWEELSEVEKAAAKLLGYNEKKWDKEQGTLLYDEIYWVSQEYTCTDMANM
jgi:hypothetical protein